MIKVANLTELRQQLCFPCGAEIATKEIRATNKQKEAIAIPLCNTCLTEMYELEDMQKTSFL